MTAAKLTDHQTSLFPFKQDHLSQQLTLTWEDRREFTCRFSRCNAKVNGGGPISSWHRIDNLRPRPSAGDSGLPTARRLSRLDVWIMGTSHNSSSPRNPWRICQYADSEMTNRRIERSCESELGKEEEKEEGAKSIRTTINQHPSICHIRSGLTSVQLWVDFIKFLRLTVRRHDITAERYSSQFIFIWWYLPCEKLLFKHNGSE